MDLITTLTLPQGDPKRIGNFGIKALVRQIKILKLKWLGAIRKNGLEEQLFASILRTGAFMWQSLVQLDVAPFNLIARAAIVYFAVLILLRISGKRQIGQMGATEFVSVLLISNAVQNSMNAGDNSLVGGILVAVVIISLSIAISFLTYKSKFFQQLFEGTPRLLIHEGKYIEKALQKEFLSKTEVNGLIRKQGHSNVSEIKVGVLEADGTLSLIRHADFKGEDFKPS